MHELQDYFTGMSGILSYERAYLYYKKLTFLAWVVGVASIPEFFTYISNIKFSRFLLCTPTYFAIQFAKGAFPFVL